MPKTLILSFLLSKTGEPSGNVIESKKLDI
jgi:hypothetical protein